MSNGKPLYSLDDEVTKWAWKTFKTRHGYFRTLFLKRFYKMEICWSDVTITQSEVNYKEPEICNEEATPHHGTQTVLIASFENDSKMNQQYTLDFQHTMKNTWKVAVATGVTHRGTSSLTLKTPKEIFEVGVTYSAEKEVTEAKEQTFENEVIWHATSQIAVLPGTQSTAIAELTTCCQVKDFSLDKFFSGTVVVDLKRKYGKLWRYTIQGEIQNIIPNNDGVWQNNTKESKATITGKCVFEYGATQRIRVSQKGLEKKSSDNDPPTPSAKWESNSQLTPISQEPSTKHDAN